MAKYDVEYTCGHEGRVNIIGPVKDREWKRQYEESKMCPDCWRKQIEEEREHKNQEAVEKAKEMELPELTGSEKQIAWANTIRQDFIDNFDEATKHDYEYLCDYLEVEKDDVLKIKHYMLENKTEARYWIDNRFGPAVRTMEHVMVEALKSGEEKEKEKQDRQFERELKAEATIYPKEKQTDAVVDISVKNNVVIAAFERNDEFRKLVKDLGYRWAQPFWLKKIKETTGSAEERVAELGNKLLNQGFPIRIYDETIRQNAIIGNFEPEHKRWITEVTNPDLLAINWPGYDDNMYQKARSLPGATWQNPSVIVKIEHYKEIEEFADLYGFCFTEKAQELVEEHKINIQKSDIVSPAKVNDLGNKDGLQEILESGSDIIDDLKDEEA